MSTNLNQKRNFKQFSRLRFYDIVVDEKTDKYRIGMKKRTFINNLKANATYTKWKIPYKFEYRPDLISDYWYGTPELWWVIQEYNDFFRVPQDFYTDRLIKISDPDQTVSMLL